MSEILMSGGVGIFSCGMLVLPLGPSEWDTDLRPGVNNRSVDRAPVPLSPPCPPGVRFRGTWTVSCVITPVLSLSGVRTCDASPSAAGWRDEDHSGPWRLLSRSEQRQAAGATQEPTGGALQSKRHEHTWGDGENKTRGTFTDPPQSKVTKGAAKGGNIYKY